MYKRKIFNSILDDFYLGKAILLVGARQVGKTTLVKTLLKSLKIDFENIITFNCDWLETKDFLENSSFEDIKNSVLDKKIIFIDEGQKVKRIGEIIKSLVDFFGKDKQVIVTGSSTLHLLDYTQEPLTGRKFTYQLFPLSIKEVTLNNPFVVNQKLNTFLLYGMYPEIINAESFVEKERLLKELVDSNLYRDILEFQDIRNPNQLLKLLKTLAIQIGKEVSLDNIGNIVGLDLRTVERYIDLLEKSFVIFRLPSFHNNKLKEIKKMNKIYFYDLGVRNSILDSFSLPDKRTDLGELWENFLIVERMKKRRYERNYATQYFWKTYDGSEVDLVEQSGDKLSGYEIKWSKDKFRKPKKFLDYTGATVELINKNNFLNVLE
jgi:predicted AAA+ superfamily ATPase